jgi:hypothetical protein
MWSTSSKLLLWPTTQLHLHADRARARSAGRVASYLSISKLLRDACLAVCLRAVPVKPVGIFLSLERDIGEESQSSGQIEEVDEAVMHSMQIQASRCHSLDPCSEIKGQSSFFSPHYLCIQISFRFLGEMMMSLWSSSDAFHLLFSVFVCTRRNSFVLYAFLDIAKTVQTVRPKVRKQDSFDQIILYGDQPKTGSYIAHVWSNKVSSKRGGVLKVIIHS